MKKVLSLLVWGCLIFILTACGSKSEKKADVIADLNKVMTNCLSENEGNDKKGNCTMNWLFQNYLKTYSSYQLLNASQSEFSAKPQEPNSLFTYGTSRDAICAYKYALFYNKDNDSYYSVSYECDNNVPTFKEVKELK